MATHPCCLTPIARPPRRYFRPSPTAHPASPVPIRLPHCPSPCVPGTQAFAPPTRSARALTAECSRPARWGRRAQRARRTPLPQRNCVGVSGPREGGRQLGAYAMVSMIDCTNEGARSPRQRRCVTLPTCASAGGSYTATYGSTRSAASSLSGARTSQRQRTVWMSLGSATHR
jgi:hypothetical protein